MAENYIIVNKAFDLLRDELASYVSAELMSVWKEMWWQTGVLDSVKNDTNLKKAGSPQELMDSMDIILCLKLLADVHWKEVFRKKLPNDCRTWAKELQDVRHNYIAHRGKGDITQDKTRRALDTMALLCEQTCNTEITEKIREIYREFTYGSAKGSTDSGE